MNWTDAAREIDAAYDIPELAGMAESIAREVGSDVVDEAHMAAALARHARHVAGDTSTGTALMIDQDTPWPVVGRDRATGVVRVTAEFMTWLEERLGRVPTEDQLADILLTWYLQARRPAGQYCPVMEAIIEEETRYGGQTPDRN